MLPTRTFAVTGATGHLGINLVLALLERGSKVRALAHSRAVPSLLAQREGIEWHVGDILDCESLRRTFNGVDGVFHLAGKISIDGDRDGTVWQCNVEGAALVARAANAAGARRIVHCGSVHALALDASTQSLEETLGLCDADKARPTYDRSKAAGLLRVESNAGADFRVISVLPSAVIGPHDPAPSRMGRVFLDLLQGRLPALTGGGFDFVDVRDVALGMIAAMQREDVAPRYVLGGHYVTLAELAKRASVHAGFRPPFFVAPLALAQASAPLALSWSRLWRTDPLYTPESVRTLKNGRPTDCARARSDLGYEPRPLDDTVRDIYASFEDPTLILK